jgi:hypothetical protein
MKALLSAAVVLLAAACAAAPRVPAAPAPVEPVGSYEFTTLYSGQQVMGTIEITGTPGAYRGRVTSDVLPEFPVQSVVVEGQEMRVAAQTPGGVATFRMTFAGGGDFVGAWELGGDTGELAGRRLP